MLLFLEFIGAYIKKNLYKNTKYDGYQRGLASIVYKCFDKNSSDTPTKSETLAMRNKSAGDTIKSEIISNRGLAEELQKQIIRKSEKLKVRSSFIDNI